jgi:thiopeptide-type bacteriocin biosynthesis protein
VTGSSGDHAISTFFVLRTPLLPFATFAALGEDLLAARPHHANADFDALLALDAARVAARMRALVARPEIREALFVASPSFDRELTSWLAGEAVDPDVPQTLVRYLARMATRPTPFGMFAGCSFGRIADADTGLDLCGLPDYRKHTRLDTGYLTLLAEGLERDNALRSAVPVRPNAALYAAAGKLRHAEGTTKSESRERSYELVAIERTPYLDATLARAAAGATETDLAAALVAEDPDIEQDEAKAYVAGLVASQILISDLAPTVTGKEPISTVIDALRAAGAPGCEPARVLQEVRDALVALDDSPLGVSAECYHAIARKLASLHVETDIARLFQIDLHKPAPGATLGGAALGAVNEAILLATRIATPDPSDAMSRFRAAFIERYGEPTSGPLATRRMVPLCEALDDETGLAFGDAGTRREERSPLLEGLEFPGDPAAQAASFGKRDERLLRGLVSTVRDRGLEWSLTDDDLAALAPGTASLPDAFAFMGTIAAPSREALARGDLRVLVDFVGGPSGAVLLGRFCHGDPEVSRAVEEHLRAEEALRPDAIFAEIVHLPEGRLGNILARPRLRTYEIPYLGRGAAPPEQQISITDLYLVLDQSRFVLFSKRLGCEIVPRLTSAHNFAGSRFAIYRFLCGLQRDGNRHAFGWTWGALSGSAFLPRVTRGKVVLSLARWSLAKEELAPLMKAGRAERFRHVQELRRRRGLPRWVLLAEGDRMLPVDLDNAVCVASFASLVARRDSASLTEMFPSPDDLVAEGPEGRFVHQLIVPFVRRAPGLSQTAPVVGTSATAPPAAIRRTFPPGSEWLYVKFHAGTASTDSVLTDVVADVVMRARRAKSLDGWFFDRRAGAHGYIGLSIRGDSRRLPRLLRRIHDAAAPLLADGRLLRIAVDTYARDIERYGGGHGIELAEAIFEADSDAVLAIVRRLDSAEAGDERWRLALRGCHELLVDLGLDLAARTEVVRRAYEDLRIELRVDKALEHGLGARFRKERAELGEALAADPDGDHPLAPALVAFARRSARVRPLAEEFQTLERGGRLSMPVHVAPSLLRAHVARLLRSDLRAHELVIVDFLRRLYVSEAARAKEPRA